MNLRNIWAVGRNYADHARELGNTTPSSEQDPMIFLKAGSCAVPEGQTFALPSLSNDIHHEVEIALQLSSSGSVLAYTLALDLTARDIQARLKEQKHPWTLAKSFRNACLLGTWRPLQNIDAPWEELANLEFRLFVNQELRQHGRARDMIHPPEKLVSYVARHFPVVEGDVLLTGTPAGVARLISRDQIRAEFLGGPSFTWTVA